MKLNQESDCVGGPGAGGNTDMRTALPVVGQQGAYGRPGVVESSEVIFSIRLLLRGPYHGGIKPEAGCEEGMATDLATLLVAIDGKNAGGPTNMGADKQPSRRDRL